MTDAVKQMKETLQRMPASSRKVWKTDHPLYGRRLDPDDPEDHPAIEHCVERGVDPMRTYIRWPKEP